MVLKCRCGWTGRNLVPNYDRGTADCPSCGRPFKGIENAIRDDMTCHDDDFYDRLGNQD